MSPRSYASWRAASTASRTSATLHCCDNPEGTASLPTKVNVATVNVGLGAASPTGAKRHCESALEAAWPNWSHATASGVGALLQRFTITWSDVLPSGRIV